MTDPTPPPLAPAAANGLKSNHPEEDWLDLLADIIVEDLIREES